MKTITYRNQTLDIDAVRALPDEEATPLLEEVLHFVSSEERESVHNDEAPCSAAHFIATLMERSSEETLIIG